MQAVIGVMAGGELRAGVAVVGSAAFDDGDGLLA